MAGGFNKGKQTDNNPGKNKPDSIKQEMMSPNSRGGGGGNTGSSNDKGKSSNERSLHSGSKSHQHHQQHQQHNSQGGGGGNLQEGKGDVSGLSAASAAALSTRDEKKFTGRCRLFVGNLTPDITEEDFRKLFQPYGEISEVYVNASKGFGFIRLDYRHNAEAAKAALDGMQRKGRTLRVRYASLGSALKVKNLSQHVSNELLHQAFSQFGEVERAVVIVDDRGRPTGEGIVEFARKPGAQAAYKRITEGVFLLSSAPRPVTVEPLDQKDEEDGYPEKFINKTDAYKKDRESEPRFAPPGSFEYEFGLRWKELEELEKQQHEGVKKAMEESRLKLEDEMENAMFEQQAEMIRQDLLRQQEELRRLEEIRQQEQIRRRQELEMRRQDEERRRQEDDRRRTDLLLRSQEIRRRQMGQESMGRDRPGDMMGRQGGSPAMNDNQQRGRNTNTGAPPLPPPPPPPAAMGLDRPGQNQMTGGGSMSGGYNYSNQGPMGGQNMGGGPGGSGNTSNSNMGGGPTGGGMTANSMVKMNQSVPNRMRQSRYDQPGDNSFGGTDNYGSAGMGSSAASAMGGGGGPPISSGQMGGGPNGPPSLFNSNMGGNMPGAGNSGMRGGGGGGGGGGGSGGGSGGAGGGSSGSGNSADRGNMMDRRRENANREDYAEMKRMRRY